MAEDGANLSVLLQPSSPNFNDSDMIPHNMNGGLYEGSPSLSSGYDVTTIKSENRILKTKLRQLQSDLQVEQDSVASLRKKLNTNERERLDAISKANEEVNRLDNEVAKLRSQLEKGEAIRQNLEYELTKAKRDINHEKRSVSERDALISEVNETMKQKIQDLTSQVEGLCDELDNTKLKANEDVRKLKRDLEDKDGEIEKLKAENDAVENEKSKMEYNFQQSQENGRDLEDKIHELEDEKRRQSDELRRQITEFEMLKEQHEMRKGDLQDASNRIKTLEEGIEAERAAHLESKFNSEIVQLRMRDLESALDLEKNTKLEAMASTEKLNQQLKDLQHIYDEERKLSLETKEKLEKSTLRCFGAEKEYASLSKQLNRELEDKRKIIRDLSKQLEAHQKDFNDLKQELNKAKKRQVHLEDTYSGCMREMEILSDNFKADDIVNTARKTTKKKGSSGENKPPGKPPQPSVLLENLRHTLITYRRKLDECTSDLGRVTDQKEQLEKESKKYKDMLWSKDKALHSSQTGVAESNKELKRVQEDNRNLEKIIRQLREDLDLVHKQVQKEKTKAHELAEQCAQVVTKNKASERSMNDFMIHLYQQLAVDVPVSEKTNVRQKSFDDLSLMITEHTTKMVNNMRWMNEKIKHLEVSLQNKEELVEQMQRAHEEQLEKLAGVAEGRSQQWIQQKAEMEKHYSQLLSDIHGRHKKTQTMADQAWEKVRMTGSLQQGLERECDDLRKQLMRMQDEHHCLLATCALLSGALYPLFQRSNALATQRDILTEQYFQFQLFKQETQKLIDALSLDKLNDKNVTLEPLKLRRLSPLLRFRTGVLAVIAANRLKNLQGGCKMFVAQDGLPGLLSAVVCTGGIEELKAGKYSGVADTAQHIEPRLSPGEGHAIEWLCSGNLLSTVLATMGDLVTTLHKARRGEHGFDQRKVVHSARNSFQKFVCHLPSTFPTVPCDSASGLRERGSLLRILGYGLNRALAQGSAEGVSSKTYLESSGNMINTLQQHILEFTKRLHMAEVERRDLRIEVNKLKKDKQVHAESSVDAERMTKELNFLRNQVEETVERQRFEQVCIELNRALQREQEAQHLLNEQSQQIHQLGMRLELTNSQGTEKEQTLTEAVKGLAEARMELKRQEQRVRQLNRQIQQMEVEKRPLEEKVKDAENALRTTARDRDSLTNYIKNVETVLKQLQAHVSVSGGQAQDFTRLLSPDLLPQNISKLGPEITACQSLVGAFVEAERLRNKRILGLQEELEQHRHHVNVLKKELSNACKREYDDELEKLQLADGQDSLTEPVTPSRPMMGRSHSPTSRRGFTALHLTKYPATNRMRRGPTEGGERK